MTMGLVLIDIQNEHFKGGKAELFNPEKAAFEAEKILYFFRRKNWPVFYIKHVSLERNRKFFMPGTSGVDIYKGVYPLDNEEVIIKHTSDSFFCTQLRSKLESKNVSHLVICGMATHICVDTTVRAARNFDYSVTVIENACTAVDLLWNGERIPAEKVHKIFMAALNGTFADIQTSDEWIEKMR